jgi:hypothetical protein
MFLINTSYECFTGFGIKISQTFSLSYRVEGKNYESFLYKVQNNVLPVAGDINNP